MRAVVFPGQGKSNFLKSFKHALPQLSNYLQEVDEILGEKMSEFLLNPVSPVTTLKMQPALLATGVAICKLAGVESDIFVGHSLGEYTAMVMAGALDLSTGLRLVHERGLKMEELVRNSPHEFGMVAVLCRDRDHTALTASFGDLVAIYNLPKQIVLSGIRKEIDLRLTEVGKKYRFKTAVLPGNIPFHTSFVRPVEEYLQRYPWREPTVPVVSNLTALPGTFADTVAATSRQVQWAKSMQYLKSQGVTTITVVGNEPQGIVTSNFKATDHIKVEELKE